MFTERGRRREDCQHCCAADRHNIQPPHAGSEACDDMVQRLDNPWGTVGSDGVVWYASVYSQRFNLR